MFKKPLVMEISNGVYAINEYGLDTMFIVEGDNIAAIIDTGMGTFDFLSLIKKITKKPYIVLLTHGHLDHAGGIDQFNEVYINKKDIGILKKITKENKIVSMNRMRGLEGDKDVFEYNEDSLREQTKDIKFLELNDGDIFDLGNRHIKAISTPGHSLGSMSFIDDKSRILFSGDSCNVNIMVTDASIESEYQSIQNILKHKNEFDRNYNGHLGFSSGLNHISMPLSVITDIEKACLKIMNGETGKVYSEVSKRYNEVVNKYIYGTITITYRSSLIFKKDEERLLCQ